MTPFPPQEGDSGATNTPNPGQSAIGGSRAVRDEMVAEVARALGYAGVSPFEIEDFRIEDVADRLWRAGYRRVSVDDATVERVARALAEHDGYTWNVDADGDVANPGYYLPRARAAVQALRDGNSQPTPSSAKAGSSHPGCPHCAPPGSCVRCGLRDAEVHELCKPCDVALEAEAGQSAALRDGGQP